MPVQLRLSERRLTSLWRPLVLMMTASLLGVMLLVSQPASRGFAQSTTILIQSSSSYVNVGDTVTVDIRIEDVPDGDSGLYGVDVRLSFDPTLLEVQDADGNPANGVQIEVGSFPAPDVIANNRADNSAGTVWYAVSQRNDLHPDPVSGSGTAASITFKCLAVGTSPVAFTYQKMVKKDGEQITATAQDGEVGATGILIQPSSSNVPVGDTVTVDIRIEAVTDLYGVDVRLSFDPTLLEVQDADGNPANGVQIEVGSFPAPDVVVNNEADNSAGTIWYAVSQRNDLHPDPVSGSGVAASVTFKGLAVGTSPVAFTYQKMVKKDGEQITATTQDGQITVKAVDLELTKDVDDANPTVGEQVMFTITISNTGSLDATGVEVEDIQWPANLTYVEHSGDGTYDKDTRIWHVGNLDMGAWATLHITATVDAEGYFENWAEVIACEQPDADSTPDNFSQDPFPYEDDTGWASGSGQPTAATLSSFAARSSAGGLSARLLCLGLAGLTVLATGILIWARRRAG